MHEIVRQGLQKTVHEALERCSTQAYDIHKQLVAEKIIRNPGDVKEIMAITDRITDGKWNTIVDDWGSLSEMQRAVIQAAAEHANNKWEIAGILTHLSAYLMVGYGTMAVVRGGRGEASGKWMGIPMS